MLREVSDQSQVSTVARKILSAVVKPLAIHGHECRITASIGISMFPTDALDAETLIKNADAAMYVAKEEGILNSSFVVLSKFLYGRPVGNEGNLKTEVIDVTMMPVPDPRGSNPDALLRVSSAFEKMKERSALQFLSERRMRRMAYTKAGRDASFRTSRIFLNSTWTTAVLSTTRSSKCSAWVMRARKALLDGLYDHLREFFENGRQKEELAISNKNRSKRKAALSPNEIAGQILAEVKSGQGHLLRAFRDFVDANKPTTALDLPASGLAEVHEDIFARDGSVRFLKGGSKSL